RHEHRHAVRTGLHGYVVTELVKHPAAERLDVALPAAARLLVKHAVAADRAERARPRRPHPQPGGERPSGDGARRGLVDREHEVREPRGPDPGTGAELRREVPDG